MAMQRLLRLAPVLVLLVVPLAGCATFQEIAQLRQVDFDLRDVSGVRLAGVELDDVRSYEDLSAWEVGRIALAVSREELPVEFVLDVGALNPEGNDVDARLTRMEWTLLLEDRETVSGEVDQEVVLPPGEPRVIPLDIGFDLYEFFDGGAEDLTEFVLSLVGEDGGPREIALEATPIIDTPLGAIRYPRPITITSRTVGGLR